MKKLLPPNSTLRTVKDSLRKPEDFVRDVLGNMIGYQGDCQVRLALDSRPTTPDYKIEFFIFDTIDGEEVAFPQTAALVKGRDHQHFPYDLNENSRPWSDSAMVYTEIQQLIGELSGKLPSG